MHESWVADFEWVGAFRVMHNLLENSWIFKFLFLREKAMQMCSKTMILLNPFGQLLPLIVNLT